MYVFEKHILVSRFMYVLKYEVSHLITGRRVPVMMPCHYYQAKSK